MTVYPVINCEQEDCFADRIAAARLFAPKDSWLHLDISDGRYSDARSFYDKDVLKMHSDYFRFEAHLMVDPSRLEEDAWYRMGVSRLLFQADSVKDWESIMRKGDEYGIEIGAAVGALVSDTLNIPKDISVIEVLAVEPGPSGQSFNVAALDTLSALRMSHPDAILTVDGGVDEQVGAKAKEAGADVLISGSYIWGAHSPEKAFKTLTAI